MNSAAAAVDLCRSALLVVAMLACAARGPSENLPFVGTFSASSLGGEVILRLKQDGSGSFERSGPNSGTLPVKFTVAGDTATVSIEWPPALRGGPVPAVIHGDSLLLLQNPSVAPLVFRRR